MEGIQIVLVLKDASSIETLLAASPSGAAWQTQTSCRDQLLENTASAGENQQCPEELGKC